MIDRLANCLSYSRKDLNLKREYDLISKRSHIFENNNFINNDVSFYAIIIYKRIRKRHLFIL